MGLGAALLFGGWLAVSSLVAGGGSYRSRLGHGVPWLPLAVLGFFGLLLALTRVPLIRRALTAPGAQQRLLSPHSFRAAGIVFVIAMLLGKLPALFAVPAGFGDTAVGIATLWVARKVRDGSPAKPLIWFTLLGIADLVSALTLGALTGFLQIVQVNPAATLNADLPLAIIPTVGVEYRKLAAPRLRPLLVVCAAFDYALRPLFRMRFPCSARFRVMSYST